MSSDNVNLISFTSNLTAGSTHITDKVLLGQYISLSIIGKSDVDLTIIIQFSGDGINWDYSVTRSLTIGANSVLASPVQGKWTRLQITNSSIVDSTYLRLFCYGTPSNSSISAQISKIGNIDPSVQVSNLPFAAFGELLIVESFPAAQYLFTRGTSGTMMSPKAWQLPYSDLKSYSTGTVSGLGATLTISNGVARFGNNFLVGDKACLYGANYRYRPGQGVDCRFTGYFTQGVKSVLGPHPTTQYIGCGSYNTTSNTIQDGYFFGYGDPTGAVDNFGIVYINNGVRTFYPRTTWNVDRCDGTYIMPAMDFSKMQVYAIQFQYLGFGMVRFWVLNPGTGFYTLVHTINRVNSVITPSNLSDPSLGLVMYQEVEVGVVPTTLNDEIGMGSFNYTLEGIPMHPNERVSVNHGRTIAAETAVLSVRCDSTFYAQPNHYCLDVDFISSSTDGTRSVIFRIYRNANITGSVWTSVAPTILPLSLDTTGTLVSPGISILSYTLAKVDNTQLVLTDLHTHMTIGDTITVTAQSTANNDVDVSLSLRIH